MRAWLLLLACLAATPSWAAHAYAQFGDIKYPPGFTHFEYVDPKAPKGGEIRMVRSECQATIGEVGNAEHELERIGKAGKKIWLGRRPRVRGVAKNPVDHPLGGGEGKSSGGRPPTSPWGKPEGPKTRHKKKASTKLIVRGRKRGKATQ